MLLNFLLASSAPTFNQADADEIVQLFVVLIWENLAPAVTSIFVMLLVLKILKSFTSIN